MKLDKLTIATAFAIALCLGSLAARSHALRSRAAATVAVAVAGVSGASSDGVVAAAIDGHLRAKLHLLAQR